MFTDNATSHKAAPVDKNPEESKINLPFKDRFMIKEQNHILGSNNQYYAEVCAQARQSFAFAKIAAMIGFGLFTLALFNACGWFGFFPQESPEERITSSILAMIAGTISQFIAAVCFFLYRKASKQFADFHICLDRANRFITANAICRNINNTDVHDKAIASLVEIIANAPPISAVSFQNERRPKAKAKTTISEKETPK